MITHYGLFWSERDVFWGRSNNPGRMLGRVIPKGGQVGRPTKKQSAKSQNFRNYVGLYCLYGDGNLLYIGQTGLGTKETLFTRIKSHKKGPLAGRWDSFSWFGRENCEGETEIKEALKQLEAITIAIINPGFNKKGGKFEGVDQVFQVPHRLAEGDTETKLENLEEMIKSLTNEVEERLPKQKKTSPKQKKKRK